MISERDEFLRELQKCCWSPSNIRPRLVAGQGYETRVHHSRDVLECRRGEGAAESEKNAGKARKKTGRRTTFATNINAAGQADVAFTEKLGI